MGEDIAPQAILDLDELQVPGGRHTGRRHILSILVENKPGVLARISGLFSRRGFNIDTLAVGPTDQVTKQLHKLVNVLKIRDLEPSETVARELALFKIAAEGESRGQVMQFAQIFRANVIDVSKRSLTVEVTGTDDKIEAFEELVRPYGLVEMVRTGEIAVARGRSTT